MKPSLRLLVDGRDNLLHVPLVPELQHPVGLVEHEVRDLLQREALGLLDVVDEAAGRGDEDVDALSQPRLFRLYLFPAHQDAGHDPGERPAQLLKVLEALGGYSTLGSTQGGDLTEVQLVKNEYRVRQHIECPAISTKMLCPICHISSCLGTIGQPAQ